MIRKGLIGAGTVVLVVLLARTLAYAAEPGPMARLLEQRAAGPAFPAVALVALALGFGVAVAVCSLAAIAVKERALIERRPAEPFAVRRMLAVACALAVATCIAGGLLEALIHWRAGLGWHGLHCLLGPVHRDLIPIETGLSFIAAAILAAARHLVVWMRRTFARLAPVPPYLGFGSSHSWIPVSLRAAQLVGGASARGPPVLG